MIGQGLLSLRCGSDEESPKNTRSTQSKDDHRQEQDRIGRPPDKSWAFLLSIVTSLIIDEQLGADARRWRAPRE
jgi:hypothetical protein